MKHPLLEGLGDDYPVYVEQHHDHVLRKIDELWDTPEIDDYLRDLLIDKRGGGARGFPLRQPKRSMPCGTSECWRRFLR